MSSILTLISTTVFVFIIQQVLLWGLNKFKKRKTKRR